MNESQFKAQIERLCTQWPSAYGGERLKIFWTAFRDADADVFSEAVSYCLATQRAAPLIEEITRAVETAKNRANSARMSGNALLNVLGDAARNARGWADKDYVRACMTHLKNFLVTGSKMTRAQFDEGCDELDKLARMLGNHKQQATSGRERAAGND